MTAIAIDKTPCGIIAIMTAPDGNVVATASDFDRQTMGGCTLWEGQRYRARQQVKFAVVRAYCSNVIVEAIDGYLCEKIADALCQRGKHKITYRTIGYPDEVASEVFRW